MSEEKKTLEAGDITHERVGRRSAVALMGGTVLGGLALTVVAPAETAQAKQSDSDGGRNADPAGRGRTGQTDSDGGRNADRAGHGRGRSGCSDSDGGNNADPGGNGRRCGGRR